MSDFRVLAFYHYFDMPPLNTFFPNTEKIGLKSNGKKGQNQPQERKLKYLKGFWRTIQTKLKGNKCKLNNNELPDNMRINSKNWKGVWYQVLVKMGQDKDSGTLIMSVLSLHEEY